MAPSHGGRLDRPVDLPSRSSRRTQSHRHHSHRDPRSDERRKSSRDVSETRQHTRVTQDRRTESDSVTNQQLVKYKDPATKTGISQDGEPLFVVDNRGDPLIVRYGTNDRSKVPEYRRSGSGQILGAQGYLHVSRDGVRETFFIRAPRDSGSIFRDKHNPLLLKAAQARSKRIRPQAASSDSQPSIDQEYIALGPSRKRKRDNEDDPDSSTDDESKLYRSIQSGRKEEPSDSELEYDDDVALLDRQSQQQDFDPLKKRSIELSRKTKEHPDDIGSWLELVQIQDELLLDADRDLTRAETQSLADIKLSMLQTAVKHARSDTDRERVLLQLMREGSKIWDSKILRHRWQEVTKENPDSFGLWRSRLDFEVSNLTTFTYESTKQFHLDKMCLLKEQLVTKSTISLSEAVSVCGQLIYVFLRTTRFMQDAGYSEMAVAAWQALLEITFARPPSMSDASMGDMRQSLMDFWDGEITRIGEDNAKGWRIYAETGKPPDVPDCLFAGTAETPHTRDVYKAWAATELRQASKSTLPGRTLDDGSDVDPFRVVMFTDIEELLFAIPISLLSEVKPQLIDAFLLFCQLPPAFDVDDLTKTAWLDPFIFTGSLSVSEISRTETTDTSPTSDRRQPDFALDGARAKITPDILFGRPHWFDYLGGATSASRTETASIPIAFSSTVVKQLARTFYVAELAEYSLALEYARDPSGIKKAARALIKLYPSNVGLYNAYAIAEHQNGNREVAEKVLSSATGQNLGAESNSNLMLWLTWAWLDLEAVGKIAALKRLCASVDEAPSSIGSDSQQHITPSQLLKARQKISSIRDHQLATGNPNVAVHAAQAYTLLEYLTAEGGTEPTSAAQGNISAALASIDTFAEELAARGHAQSAAHERLLQFAARLLYWHATRGPFRPVYLREQLLGFVRAFPRNSIFLSLFAWAESGGARIDDPVRRALREVSLADPHDCLSSRLFSVRHELRVGNAHSVRAAFERALRSDALGRGGGGAAPALWREYVRFCYGSRELRPRAKDVYYRAVHACPWSKGLIMEAFSTVVRDMDSSELRAVFNTMTEKGLRVHVELGEFVDKWKEEQRKRNKS